MNYQQAKKLFNGDEVQIKKTNEIVKTIDIEVGNHNVFIRAMVNGEYKTLTHKDVK